MYSVIYDTRPSRDPIFPTHGPAALAAGPGSVAPCSSGQPAGTGSVQQPGRGEAAGVGCGR